MKKISFILIMMLILALNSIPQTGNWINFSKNENIRCILDDSNLLWIGSSHGLLMYDKIQDTIFLFNASNSGLLENTVDAICKDNEGALWIATLNEGIVKYNGENWIEINAINDYLTGEYYTDYITDIFIDSNNVKWMTSSHGLLVLDNIGLTVFNDSNSNIPSDQLNSIIKDYIGFVWIGASGLIKYDGSNWDYFTSIDTNLPLGQYTGLNYGINNEIWCKVGPHLVKIDTYEFTKLLSPLTDFYSFEVDQYDTIVMGIHSGEYAFQKYHDNTWITYNTSNCGITNNHVDRLAIDNDNTQWFTGEMGLDKLSANNSWYFRKLSNSELPNNRINSIAIGKNGLNYFCTPLGIIGYNWNGWTDLIEITNCHQVNFDNNEDLLIANPYAVYVYDGLQIDTLATPFFGLAYSEVNKVIVDHENNIWMTFPNDWNNYMKGGVFMYNGSEWTTFNESNSGLPHSNVNDIAVDTNNNIWFGTSDGLAKYSNGIWTVYNTNNSPLPNNEVTSLTIDSINNIWATTMYEAFVSFDGTNWNVYQSPIYPIISYFKNINFDSNGNIWGVGLSKIVKFDMTSWDYYDADNSPIPHNNTLSLAIDQNDNIFIGSRINGLYIYNENGIDPVITYTHEKIEIPICSIYPNPTNGKINIELSSETRVQDIHVYSIVGKNINYRFHSNNNQLAIDLSNQVKGIYILQIMMNKNMISKKVILH